LESHKLELLFHFKTLRSSCTKSPQLKKNARQKISGVTEQTEKTKLQKIKLTKTFFLQSSQLLQQIPDFL